MAGVTCETKPTNAALISTQFVSISRVPQCLRPYPSIVCIDHLPIIHTFVQLLRVCVFFSIEYIKFCRSNSVAHPLNEIECHKKYINSMAQVRTNVCFLRYCNSWFQHWPQTSYRISIESKSFFFPSSSSSPLMMANITRIARKNCMKLFGIRCADTKKKRKSITPSWTQSQCCPNHIKIE